MTQPPYEPCTWPTVGTDVIGALCTACGHNQFVHPGLSNSGIRACVICELVQLRDELRAHLTSRRELPVVVLAALHDLGRVVDAAHGLDVANDAPGDDTADAVLTWRDELRRRLEEEL